MKKALFIALKLLAFALLLLSITQFLGEIDADAISKFRSSVGFFAGPIILLGKAFWGGMIYFSARILIKSAR